MERRVAPFAPPTFPRGRAETDTLATMGIPIARSQACESRPLLRFRSTCIQNAQQDLTITGGRLLRRPEPRIQYASLNLPPDPGVGTSLAKPAATWPTSLLCSRPGVGLSTIDPMPLQRNDTMSILLLIEIRSWSEPRMRCRSFDRSGQTQDGITPRAWCLRLRSPTKLQMGYSRCRQCQLPANLRLCLEFLARR